MQKIQKWLTRNLADLAVRHDVPGVQVAVLADGQVAEEVAGVLNVRTGVAVTPRSVFQVGSITKLLTATLVMQLADEGMVELDLPIRRYLPTFRVADDEASERITTRHLLSHTAGFFGDLDVHTTNGSDAIRRLIEDVVPWMPQMFPPGERYSYTNAGYDVLGRLVEATRGMPYADVLRQYLLDPLGLVDSAIGVEEAILRRAAVGHLPGPDGPEPTTRWGMCPSGAACGSTLCLSARELVQFARMHLTDGLNASGKRLLSRASSRAMRDAMCDHPPLAAYPKRQGLGWILLEHPDHPSVRLVEHGGGTIGQGGLLLMLPDRGIAVAVLSNGGDAGTVEREIIGYVLEEMMGIGQLPEYRMPASSAIIDDFEHCLGTYRTPLLGVDVEIDVHQRMWWTMSIPQELPSWLPRQQQREYEAIPSERYELRPITDEAFIRVTPSGEAAGVVVFAGRGEGGRATLHYDWEAAMPRAD